ncbi:MAG: TonB-dependent receptor [Ignavibacteria bacterium]
MKKITYIIIVFIFILKNSHAIILGLPAIQDTTGIKNDTIKTYTTKEILIQDRTKFFDKISSGFIKRITSTEQITSTSIGNLLASKPGIFTKSYGSEGSLQTVSIRGSGSEYTSVFINGINYNNSLNGVFDFSKFSADEMNEIIIKKGNDFEPLNSNSFGGVIELNPFEKNDTSSSVIKLQTGSFGYQGLQLKSTGLILNTYYKIQFSHKSAKNNYEYSFNNETGIRKNSDVNQNTINLAFVNSFEIFNQPVRINSFLNLMDKKLGLPNFVSSNRHNDSGTREQEKSLSYSLNSKVFVADWIYINGIFGVNQNHLNIDDPLLSINLRTKSFKLKDNSISSKFFINFISGKLFLTSGLAGIYENFDKNEFKENQTSSSENFYRKTFSANFKVNFEEILSRNLLLNSSVFVSYNSISNYYQSTFKRYEFPNIRIGLSIKSNQHNIFTFANAGTGIRIPNFYEYSISKLTSLSSKELEPEKILNYEAGIRFEKEELLIELIYFTFDVQNKIIWIPQRVAFFSPINSGRIKSSGIEFNLENLKLSKNFSVEANYTFTNALKKFRLGETDNAYNKQIPYIPKHKASISLNFTSKLFEITFNSNYYGRRFITEDNDELFSLDPVIISNLSTTHRLNINQIKFSFQLSIQNLFNTSYQLIQSFPMPGREYRLTIQMEV